MTKSVSVCDLYQTYVYINNITLYYFCQHFCAYYRTLLLKVMAAAVGPQLLPGILVERSMKRHNGAGWKWSECTSTELKGKSAGVLSRCSMRHFNFDIEA